MGVTLIALHAHVERSAARAVALQLLRGHKSA